MPELKLEVQRTALLVMDFQKPIVECYVAGREALLAATASAIAAARAAGVRVIYVVVGFREGFPEISPRNQGFAAVKAMTAFSTEIDPQVAPAPGEVVITKHRVSAFYGTDLDMILRAQDMETLALCGIATSGVVLSTLRHAADADYRLLVLRDCWSDQTRGARRWHRGPSRRGRLRNSGSGGPPPANDEARTRPGWGSRGPQPGQASSGSSGEATRGPAPIKDGEVHACLCDKIFPRQAQVITAAAFAQSLRA